MTTPTIDLIHRHGSVRNYKPDAVAPELIETVVAAGQRSSTSSNLQMYSVVAVLDSQRRAQMAALCGNQKHILQAPVFLAWCADLSRLDRMCRRRGYGHVSKYVENFLLAAVDVSVAMQTAALAAESLGLGICYIGAIRNNPREVIDMLELPHLVAPVSGMTMGWPQHPPTIRPRLPTSAVLHWEAYDPAGEEQALDAYDRAMIDTGIYRGRQVAVAGGPDTVQDYGWQEHSARRVSQVRRPQLRQVLGEQGFHLE